MKTFRTCLVATCLLLTGLGSARATSPASPAPGAAAGVQAPAPGAVTALEVAFRLDPRLTRSLYMGDRWVSPATFQTPRQGKPAVVQASARGVVAYGRRVEVPARWVADDPGMVEISPQDGGVVSLRITRAGTSTVRVEFREVKRTLTVEASEKDGALSVRVAQ
jgi:hypothetical protein